METKGPAKKTVSRIVFAKRGGKLVMAFVRQTEEEEPGPPSASPPAGPAPS